MYPKEEKTVSEMVFYGLAENAYIFCELFYDARIHESYILYTVYKMCHKKKEKEYVFISASYIRFFFPFFFFFVVDFIFMDALYAN